VASKKEGELKFCPYTRPKSGKRRGHDTSFACGKKTQNLHIIVPAEGW